MSVEFKEYLKNVLKKQFMGNEIQRIYGETFVGQEYAFVITKKLWYAVRLIINEEYQELEHVLRPGVWIKGTILHEQFLTLQKAKEYVNFHMEEFSNANFPNVPYRIRKVPKDVLENPDIYLKPGDQIQRSLSFCPIFYHEGVYLGNGLVAHIADEDNGIKGSGRSKSHAHARLDSIANFLTPHFQNIYIVAHCFRRIHRDDICATAIRLVNESYGIGEYNFLKNNCQHFAALCVLGFKWMVDREHVGQHVAFLSINGVVASAIIIIGGIILFKNK